MSNNGYKQTYTKNAYSRGSMRTRDFIAEGFASPHCIICGNPIERGVGRSGRPAEIKRWLSQKTCGRYWDEQENKYKFTECLLRFNSGKGNPNYKGIMDRPCKICGKTGLSYVASLKGEKQTEICRECHDKNRKEPKTKKPRVMIKCNGCGKKIKNTWESGRLRGKEKSYCSKSCANKTNFSK